MADAEHKMPDEQWQILETRWRTILGMEASIESARAGMESLRIEMESAFRQSLNAEEKTYALQADVANWNKAKNRIHYTLPKLREFVHKATWALGIPERKKLEEIFKNFIEPRIVFPELGQVSPQLDSLLKDRQLMSVHGNSVAQECRGICADIRSALSALQRNAATRARAVRDSKREKGKY